MKAENKPRTNVTASTILTHPCFYTGGRGVAAGAVRGSLQREEGVVGGRRPGGGRRGGGGRALTAPGGGGWAGETRRGGFFFWCVGGGGVAAVAVALALKGVAVAGGGGGPEIRAPYACSYFFSGGRGITNKASASGSRSPWGKDARRGGVFEGLYVFCSLLEQGRGGWRGAGWGGGWAGHKTRPHQRASGGVVGAGGGCGGKAGLRRGSGGGSWREGRGAVWCRGGD